MLQLLNVNVINRRLTYPLAYEDYCIEMQFELF